MVKDPSLRTIIMFMTPVIILYGLYVLLHGDYSPGGGFQAGTIIASAIILYGIFFGPTITLKTFSMQTIKITAASGVLLYAGVGLTSIIFEKEFLAYSVLLKNSIDGQKLGIFLIELGVTLTVAASLLIIYFSLAQRKGTK